MNKIILAVAAVVIVALGGFFLLSNNQTQAPSQDQVSPTQTPEATSQASPSPESATDDETEGVEIELTKSGYNPSKVTVKVGQKITFTNNSGAAATVSSDPHPAHTLFPVVNLGPFQDGDTHTLVIDKPGTYTYHNHLNSSQKGTIVVE